MQPFYIILRSDKPETYVTRRHCTFEEVKQEAERLARKEGKAFHVMILFATVQPIPPAQPPLEWIKAQEPESVG